MKRNKKVMKWTKVKQNDNLFHCCLMQIKWIEAKQFELIFQKQGACKTDLFSVRLLWSETFFLEKSAFPGKCGRIFMFLTSASINMGNKGTRRPDLRYIPLFKINWSQIVAFFQEKKVFVSKLIFSRYSIYKLITPLTTDKAGVLQKKDSEDPVCTQGIHLVWTMKENSAFNLLSRSPAHLLYFIVWMQ